MSTRAAYRRDKMRPLRQMTLARVCRARVTRCVAASKFAPMLRAAQTCRCYDARACAAIDDKRRVLMR